MKLRFPEKAVLAAIKQKEAITPEQRKFLTEVLSYYKEFAAAAGTDQQTRYRTARAAFRVGMIEFRLGQKEGQMASLAGPQLPPAWSRKSNA